MADSDVPLGHWRCGPQASTSQYQFDTTSPARLHSPAEDRMGPATGARPASSGVILPVRG